MNRLWVRLSLTYGAVIVIAFVSVSLISLQLIRANAEQAAAAGQEIVVSGMVARVTTYYEEHGSWDGIDAVFTDVQGFINQGRDDFFLLESPEGTILYGRDDAPPDKAIMEGIGSAGAIAGSPDLTLTEVFDAGAPPPRDTRDITPITVDGQTVAMLSVPSPRTFFFPLGGMARDVGFEQLLILMAITIAVISLLFGIIISRWLTNPLDHLAVMAQDIGKGKMDRRVKMTGTVETVSLASTFNRMVDELQDVEQKRRNLVADVAHELRTPIAALQAGLYAILDDAYPMTKSEIAGLYEQTRMLSRLVSDLHELTQADSNQLPLDCQPIDLADAIEDFVAPFRIVAESEAVTFQVKVAEALPLVRADQSRINQVLHNLLSNALRHTPEGGAITIDVHSAGNGVEISVADTGDGISAEHLPHVFERFYRGDYGRSRDQGGTGLGLAIARALAEAHHGTLEAISEGVPGKGATFTLRLPA